MSLKSSVVAKWQKGRNFVAETASIQQHFQTCSWALEKIVVDA